MLYEILTGEPPFVGDSPVAVAYQHVREDPVPPSQRHSDIAPELDAVVLKALAKNPDNRYQTAAEMRADLVRVHSGEAPDAPKVLTDAERLAAVVAPRRTGSDRAHRPRARPQPAYAERDRGASVGRWLIAVAVLAVLTVVVTVAINMFGGSTRDVQVPDVSRQELNDAIAALQNARLQDARTTEVGFRDSDRARDRHRPRGGHLRRRRRRDHDQCVVWPRAARDPGRQGLPTPDRPSRSSRRPGSRTSGRPPSPSTPEQKGTVLQTNPQANQTTAITNEITIVVGSGPDSKPVPDVKGRTADDAQRILAAVRVH